MSINFDQPTAEPKPDRRSQRTQQMLTEALLTLLASKHYDAISIKDIVDQANVGRSTFYVHYQTKDDLLLYGLGHMLDNLLQQIVLSRTDQTLRLDTTFLFSHAREHYEIYRTLVWGSGFELLIRDGHATLNAKLQERLAQLLPDAQEWPIPLPVLSYCMGGTLLILLKWWLDNKMPYSPERMDEIFQQLVMPGVRTTLGLTGD
jgi:AcrR family transcriptional regulator